MDAPPPFYIYIFDATANEVHHHERWCRVSMKDIFIYIHTYTHTMAFYIFNLYKRIPTIYCKGTLNVHMWACLSEQS